MFITFMDGGGEKVISKSTSIHSPQDHMTDLPQTQAVGDFVRERTGRQSRYSEQREKLANRVAERKVKAGLGDASYDKKSSEKFQKVQPKLEELSNIQFASDLEAKWRKEMAKGSPEVDDEQKIVKSIKTDKVEVSKTKELSMQRDSLPSSGKDKGHKHSSRSTATNPGNDSYGRNLCFKQSQSSIKGAKDGKKDYLSLNPKIKEHCSGSKSNKQNPPDKTNDKDKVKEGESRADEVRIMSPDNDVSDMDVDTRKTDPNSTDNTESEDVSMDDEKKKALDKAQAKLKEQKKLEEELTTVSNFAKDAKERIELKDILRAKNISAADNRPDESFFSKLDSSMKKNTAFVKRVKGLTENQGEFIFTDFEHLNLSRYIGEVASALTDAKLKMGDVPTVVKLCSLLHQRYADFSSILLENLIKILPSKKDTKISNPSKYRVDLRILADLTAVSIFPGNKGLSCLANQLSILESLGKDHSLLPIVIMFCKHNGDDYAGLLPRNIRLLSSEHNIDIPRSQVLPPERQKNCRNLLKAYFNGVSDDLVAQHKQLKKIEHSNMQSLRMKGELSQERKEVYEQGLDIYRKLHANVSSLANALDEDIPDLPQEEFKPDSESAFFGIYKPDATELPADMERFEDEDTRMFYEKLTDLKAIIPSIVFKDSEQVVTTEENTSLEEEMDVDEYLEEDLENLSEIPDGKEAQETDEDPVDEPTSLPDITEDDAGETNNVMKAQLDKFLTSLPTCVNRDLIDKAAIEFCMNFNTKTSRRKLVQALFQVHRTRYDLLPFYSRLIATLQPCMSDVATDIVAALINEMKWHIRKKYQLNIESKLKTARFIGELVKFRIFPSSECLHLLKMLIFSFTRHNIEMACALLEACGRFLYRSKETHHRISINLEVMQRKKTAMLHLDPQHQAMIDNAYYYCNPPDVSSIPRKTRPPVHEYIRKLIFRDLSKLTTEKILRQIRKLNWDDEEICIYCTKCLSQPWNVKYNVIYCLANLLSGLHTYHESVVISVVDSVTEDIRMGMELNHPRYNQRRVACVKYLGEMYNYRVVESAHVFSVLYSVITFGVSLSDSEPSILDPPDHLLRLRLVCILLDTCGQYFETGSSKRRLDCFLVYFQRYYWYKKKNPVWSELLPFPMDVNNMYIDMLEALQISARFESYDEASKAAESLSKELRAKLSKVVPDFNPAVESQETKPENLDMMEGLSTVFEEDETEEINDESKRLSANDDNPSHVALEEGGSMLESDNSYSQLSQDASQKGSGSDMDVGVFCDGSDENVKVIRGLRHVPCPEDDEFSQAFDKMMTDTIQARSQESLKVPQLDIAVPLHLKNKLNKVSDSNNGSVSTPLQFVLITRKGNKQQFSNMEVPMSAEFASKYREREKAEKEEQRRIKQAVLNIHERQEEEDYEELISAMTRPSPANTNRDRRVQYQHPKGAPDADLIFGSKKR